MKFTVYHQGALVYVFCVVLDVLDVGLYMRERLWGFVY